MTEKEKAKYLLRCGWVSDSGKRWQRRNFGVKGKWLSLGEAMEVQRKFEKWLNSW